MGSPKFYDIGSVCAVWTGFKEHCCQKVLPATMFPRVCPPTIGIKKVPIYRLYNGTGNTVPFPFRLISVRLPFLSVFKTFPFCPKGSPSVLVNGPDGEIKCAWSLVAQEGLQQFGDHDRTRARAT